MSLFTLLIYHCGCLDTYQAYLVTTTSEISKLSHEIIIYPLRSTGIKGKSYLRLESYIVDRKMAADSAGNSTQSQDTIVRVPQGNIQDTIIISCFENCPFKNVKSGDNQWCSQRFQFHVTPQLMRQYVTARSKELVSSCTGNPGWWSIEKCTKEALANISAHSVNSTWCCYFETVMDNMNTRN